MYLPKNIRYLRKKNNLSQDDLASKMGYKSYTTIQKWESGVSEPPFKTLVKLSEIFDCDMDDMINVNLEFDSSGTSQEYSSEELELIQIYRSLNDRGKQMLFDQAHLMYDSEAYRKDIPSRSGSAM